MQASSTTNVRDNAAGNILGTHATGDKGVIKAGPTVATLSGTSYTWYQVQWTTSPTLGWSINTNLSKVAATPCDILVQGTPSISPNPAQAGSSITVSYTIKNQGGSTASASQTKIQIKNSSGTEIIAPTFSDPSIAAGGTSLQSHTVTIPSSANAGTYTCYVILDNTSALGQSNTSNDYTTGVNFSVTEPQSCSYSISPTSTSSTSTAGSGSFTVTTSTGCSWSAVSNNTSWLNITSGSIGSGNGTVNYSYSANTSTTSRTATITVAGQTFTVTQAGAAASPKPSITSVNPNPITADANNNYQSVTINGSNFVQPPTIKLTWTGQTNYTLPTTQITSVTSNQIVISIKLGNVADSWMVEVINPDGQTTGQSPFTVVTSTSCSSCNGNPCFGTLLGSFNGVNAYSNCTAEYDSQTYNYETGINTGLKYQCVEFVNRYYKIVYGLDLKSTGIYGNANHYYSNASTAGLTAYPNGGSVAPQIGDILCSNGNSSNIGHVAIVKAVNSTSIDVIEQNFSNAAGGCYATLSRSGNTISGFGTTSNYPVTGWLRYPSSSNPTPTITSVSPSSILGSTTTLQALSIYGTNFTSASYLVFYDTAGNLYYSYDHPERFTYINSGQINYNINDMNDCGTWHVVVYNNSTNYSNSFPFSVTATSSNNKISGFDTGNTIKASSIPSDIFFGYFKATESTYSPDKEFTAGNIVSAQNKGIVVGAYHFGTPLFSPAYYQSNYDHQNTVSEEVTNYLNSGKIYIGKGYLPPMLDIETQTINWVKNANGTYSPNQTADPLQIMGAYNLAQWIHDWIILVYNQTHVMPILYITKSYAQALYPYYQNGTIPNGITPANYPACKLFIATNSTSETAGNPITSGWNNWPWVFHQWSPDEQTSFGLVDLDVFNGDINAFNNLINNGGTAGVIDVSNNLDISIYPNPVSDYLNITSDKYLITEVTLYTTDGKQIENEKINRLNKLTLDFDQFSNGFYILVISTENGSQSFKIIKK